MSLSGFDELADLAMRKSGQALRRSQVYLVEARLGSILRRENFSTLSELSNCLQARPNPAFEDEVVAAMAGKDTAFFQDKPTLDYIINTALPKLAQKQNAQGENRSLRILCAGGGTGQEAYSLAIALDEAGSEATLGRKIEIISIDICKASTQRARAGLFGHFEIQMGLSVHRMLKYFTRQDDAWRISEAMRGRVSFEVENLMQPFSGAEPFDIVLCRNVISNMASSFKEDIAKRLSGLLGPDGMLFLGKDEHLSGVPGLVTPFAHKEEVEAEFEDEIQSELENRT